MFLVKYDSNGNEIWGKDFGGSRDDEVKSIVIDNNGNAYITGAFKSDTLWFDSVSIVNNNILSYDIFLSKFNSNGNPLWAKKYGGNNDDYASSVIIDSGGGIYITGTYNYAGTSMEFDSFSRPNGGLYVVKHNSDGSVLWLKGTIGNGSSGLTSAIDTMGNVFVGGSTGSDTLFFDTHLVTRPEGHSGTFIAKLDYHTVNTIIQSKVTCYGGNDASATAVANFGTPPYTYLWDTQPSQITQIAAQLSAGSYIVTVTDSYGDTLAGLVTITEPPKIVTTIPQNICEGDIFFFKSQELSTPGIYNDTLTSINGCDSIVELNLFVHLPDTTRFIQNICPGSTYNFHGLDVSSQGSYYHTLTSSFGCDSVIEMNILFHPVYADNISTYICNGDFYEFNENVYDTTGIYVDTLASALGCDSIIITHLEVILEIFINNLQAICNGSSYNINGNSYSSEGLYTDTLTSVLGCDSIVSTIISILPTYLSGVSQSICEGSSTTFRGTTYQAPGIYYDTLTSVYGCDSIFSLNLEVHPNHITAWSYEIDYGESVDFFGIILDEEGKYYNNLNSVHGCDSTIVAEIRIRPETRLWIPNAFYPKSLIPENQLFLVKGLEIQNINLSVINRQGKLVFHSNNINQGWDGRSQDGKELPPEVYTYVVRVRFNDDTETEKTGNVTLLR